MDNQNNNNNIRKTPTSQRFSWGRIILTTILIVTLVVVFYLMFAGNSGKYTSYNDFKQNLANGNVNKVEFNATTIEFEYLDGTKGWFYTRSSTENQVWSDLNTYPTNSEGAQVIVLSQKNTSFSILSIIYPVLLIVGLLLLTTFIIKQIGKSNNKSFDFVKNRARISQSKVKFEDVAGVEEEKEEVREIVEFLKNPQKFTAMGARIPKGVLLIGAPGTGKTLLAKAIAGEANVPFFTISGSDFMELFVGVGASRVRDLFDQAKKSSPCIVFIDEIDAIGRQRGTGLGGGNDEREQTLNQLLVQMDGFEPNEGIIVIAATNRADILDPALMRPGRFDRQIYVQTPDVRGREEILKVHAKNKKIANDVNFTQIARITSGFTGADIENLLNEAAILAARDNKNEITMKEITEGIDKVTMGPQKKSRIVTDRDKKITAIHESGHAIISKFVKNSDPVHEVSIIPRGSAAGYTVSRPDTDDNHVTKSKLMDMITMMLGGRAAEKIFISDVTTGASNDIMRATTIARKMVMEFGMSDELGLMHLGSENSYFFGKDYVERATYSETSAATIDKEIKKIIDVCQKEAESIISKNKKIIETMVEVLLAKDTIYSDEVDMIISGKPAKTVINFIDNKNKSPEEKVLCTEEKDTIKDNKTKKDVNEKDPKDTKTKELNTSPKTKKSKNAIIKNETKDKK